MQTRQNAKVFFRAEPFWSDAKARIHLLKDVKRSAVALTAAGVVALLPPHRAMAMTDKEQLQMLLGQVKQLKARMDKKDREEQERRRAETVNARSANVRETALTPVAAVAMPRIPDRFVYKGLEIIPGGFLALESVWRNHWVGADVATPFNAIPYGFATAGHTDEFHFSARATRPALLVRGDLNPTTHIQGYFETDFLGAAQTANANQSNSYNLRVRQAYTNIDNDDYGLHFTAGQTWSLVTMNSLGTRPDTSLQPPTIDHNYMPGYVWDRNPGIRIYKDFGKQFWLALAAEGSANTFAAPGPGFGPVSTLLPNNLGIPAPALLALATNGGSLNTLDTYSFNRLPDLVGKAAWDAPLGDRTVHLEAFGVAREITERVYFGNHRVWVGGVGAGAVIPFIPKILEFQVSGMIGRGVGRLASSQLPDATYSVFGALQPLHQRSLLVGATLHPTPQTDVFAFAGGDIAGKNPQVTAINGTIFAGGYGNPLYNNIGCSLENPISQVTPGVAAAVPLAALGNPVFNCSGQTHALREITAGAWHTLYEGPAGKIRVGVQFAHIIRNGFNAVGGAPRGSENTILTSFRYFPF
ncbi:hypothetical protein IYY11_19635 [Methylocystis sp. H62]|nr:hypothetical protein [Methylocystis sp. H62]